MTPNPAEMTEDEVRDWATAAVGAALADTAWLAQVPVDADRRKQRKIARKLLLSMGRPRRAAHQPKWWRA